MGRRKARFNLVVLAFLVVSFAIYKFISWILTFSLFTWILIGFVLLGVLLLRNQMKQRRLLREAEKRKLKLKRLGNLNELKKMNPFAFENFVCELFVQLGYDAHVTNMSGDGGKDILIYKGDSFAIAECKRYDKQKISRPAIQKFHSAIMDCKADKGFFITTSDFTKQATSYVIDKPIELVHGERLVYLIEEITKQVDDVPTNILESYLETT